MTEPTTPVEDAIRLLCDKLDLMDDMPTDVRGMALVRKTRETIDQYNKDPEWLFTPDEIAPLRYAYRQLLKRAWALSIVRTVYQEETETLGAADTWGTSTVGAKPSALGSHYQNALQTGSSSPYEQQFSDKEVQRQIQAQANNQQVRGALAGMGMGQGLRNALHL
jgi:hypothetical protein